MSWKIDELGTYDDEMLPDGLTLPLMLNETDEALTGNDGVIALAYSIGTIETAVRMVEKRKAEFIMKLANGEVIVRKDKSGKDHVFKRTKQSLQGGKIVIEYDEVKQLAHA